MNTILDYFNQAELALAAYGNLESGDIDPRELVTDAVGMSPAQATRFARDWRVVEQYSDPLSGLSATVFEEVATRQRYLAIRGT
ncbi:MAG: hypothetical protein COW56_13585, partial [Rhodocyclales bacterium CG17_big_fil_post_rev_8_21_14_2_50_68_7]